MVTHRGDPSIDRRSSADPWQARTLRMLHVKHPRHGAPRGRPSPSALRSHSGRTWPSDVAASADARRSLGLRPSDVVASADARRSLRRSPDQVQRTRPARPAPSALRHGRRVPRGHPGAARGPPGTPAQRPPRTGRSDAERACSTRNSRTEPQAKAMRTDTRPRPRLRAPRRTGSCSHNQRRRSGGGCGLLTPELSWAASSTAPVAGQERRPRPPSSPPAAALDRPRDPTGPRHPMIPGPGRAPPQGGHLPGARAPRPAQGGHLPGARAPRRPAAVAP